MRMMLPEHIARIREDLENEKKIDRPILDEDELEQIGRTLQEAIEKHSLIELSHYKDGFIKQAICYPVRLDPITKQLIVHDSFGIKWKYDFQDVIDVHLGGNEQSNY
ncbi:YolD-like family protein [Sporolactobacillus sp. STSJ-5]|uniref:YolD-like family protein n=1 Tax=Sporolactobacillus sp. STSJ-5 TaxID=2965076 RepID=UPI0021073F11|nr:YolD-like family protein [Sporolactobacillus sp. STSJ-5]MCQ2010525.1 YolD-like family protein [Sporolactobacillus sp. STSJ-5]